MNEIRSFAALSSIFAYTHTSSTTLSNKYRPEIDGLRAIAVIAATINNFWESFLPCGYLGVDMFAVISGYVITSSLYKRPHRDLQDLLTGFYARRFKRLIPGLVVMVIVIFTLSLFVIPQSNYSLVSIRTGISALAGASNLYLIKQSLDYFAYNAKINPFTATWSLSCEEQYYLIFPFIIWFTGFGRQTKNGTKNLFITIIALSTLSILGFVYYWFVNRTIAYFLMPTRFWEMGFGCLVFLTYQKSSGSRVSSLRGFPVLLLLLILLGTFFLPLEQGLVATFAVVVTTTAIILGIEQLTTSYDILTNPLFRFIARISYSLYLYRWAILSLSLWCFSQLENWMSVLLIILMFVVASVSTFFIEEPLKKLKWTSSRTRDILLSIGVSLGAAFSLFTVNHLLNSWINRVYLGAVKEGDLIMVQTQLNCEKALVKNKSIPASSCLLRKNLEPSIFILGSSHASNLVPSVRKVSQELGYSGVYYITNQKDFWDSNFFTEFKDSLTDQDLILYARDQEIISSNKGISEITSNLKLLTSAASNSGAKLFLVNDIHNLTELSFAPSLKFPFGKGVSYDQAIQARKNYTSYLTKFVNNKTVFIIDPINSVCKNSHCDISLNGKIIFADSSPHFNVTNGKYVLSEFFGKNLPRVNSNL